MVSIISVYEGRHTITIPFDPFTDRTARDIRNSLSSAFVEELTGNAAASVTVVAEQWMTAALSEIHTDYIKSRRTLYQKIVLKIRSENISNPRYQAILLWNAELFFELHELLETIWMKTQGEERMALKGLIQAAGAYVHNKRGKPEAASGLASKARQNILAGSARLGFIANLDELIEGLEQLTKPAPVLVGEP